MVGVILGSMSADRTTARVRSGEGEARVDAPASTDETVIGHSLLRNTSRFADPNPTMLPPGGTRAQPNYGRSNRSCRPSFRNRSHSRSPAGSRRVTRKNQPNRSHSCGSSLRIPGWDIR